MSTFFFWMSMGFCVGVVCASFFEWTLHRYFMHRPFFTFRYPYERHALVHHRIFKADHTYHLINESDKKTIPMAWWNGPVLIAVGQLPFLAIALWFHKWGWGIMCGAAIASTCYYAAYEYIHWCMHLPKKRHLERSGIFFRLNGHHLLHHRYMSKNYNVVFPLADFFLMTLLFRSKIHFNQAVGPSVPNVQPKMKPVSSTAG